ncbi:MAG: ATP-dependent helicase RecG, partial [Verrucomicrobiota bacterium]
MTKAASIHLDTALDAVPGMPAFALKMLNAEGIQAVGELISCYPARHEDRRHVAFKGFSPSETPVCHHVRVLKTRVLRFGKGGGVFEAVVESAHGNLMNQQLTLRWFKMTFLQKVLAVDMELMVYGRIKEVKARLIMDHPDYEVVRDEEDEATAKIHTGRIVPVYRLRGGLKQKPLRAAIWQIMEQMDDTIVPDLLPQPKSAGEFTGMSRGRALRTLHHPLEHADLEHAKRYLALEEFYLMQLRVVKRKLRYQKATGWKQESTGTLTTKFLENLPFQLTDAQQRCLEEIQDDMAEPRPMNRLLHGDVGSGKTVVAMAAMLTAVESGQQAALMAPTQILAEQHYANALRWLEPLGVRVALRTGSKREREDDTSSGSARFQRAASGILP